MQEGHIIRYKSKKLKDNEKNNETHDLQLEITIDALKTWRHYLIGRKVYLKINNVSLKYLFDQLDMHDRQERCLTFLSE